MISIYEPSLLLKCLFLIVCFVVLYLMNRKNDIRFWVHFCVSLYIVLLLDVVIFPIRIYAEEEEANRVMTQFKDYIVWIQLIPFKTIKNTLLTSAWKQQIIGNVILLLPVPAIEFFYSKMNARPVTMLLPGIIASISIELMQLFISLLSRFPSRVCDIDDVILNSIGVLLGFGICSLLKKVPCFVELLNKILYYKKSE